MNAKGWKKKKDFFQCNTPDREKNNEEKKKRDRKIIKIIFQITVSLIVKIFHNFNYYN